MMQLSQMTVEDECTKDRHTDMTVYHHLSLNLMSRLHHGDEYIARHLLSNVLFNINFLRQVFLVELTSVLVQSCRVIDTLAEFMFLLEKKINTLSNLQS